MYAICTMAKVNLYTPKSVLLYTNIEPSYDKLLLPLPLQPVFPLNYFAHSTNVKLYKCKMLVVFVFVLAYTDRTAQETLSTNSNQ